MAYRVTNQQLFAYCPEQGGNLDPVGYGTCSSNGAAGGTTLIDANGVANSGAGNTYVGNYWVTMLSGSNQGLSKRIVVDNGSGTLTFENNGFPNQVASGDEYMLWVSPEAVIFTTAGGSTTTTVDSDRDESDDYWIDYSIAPLNGSAAGDIFKVTDFANSTGTFTHATVSNAVGSAKAALLLMPIEAGNVSRSLSEEYIPKLASRVNFARGDGRVGPRSGSLTFDVHVTGSGSLASADADANKSVLHGLMQACGLEEVIGKTMTISDASATTTSIDVVTGDGENVKIGQAIQYKGNVTYVTDKTDGGGGVDTLTVSPPLPVSPQDSTTLEASRMYKKDIDADQNAVTIYWEIDGIRHTFFGCRGNVEFIDGPLLMARFTMNFIHYVREHEPAQFNPGAVYTTSKELRGMDRVVYVDTTATDIGGFTATPGTEVAMVNTSGRYGVNGVSASQMINIVGGATFNEMIETTDILDAESLWQARTSFDLSVVYGSHGDCVAIRIPTARLVEAPHPTDQDGMQAAPYVVEAQDAGVFTDPDDGITKVPDWAVHIF